MSTAQTDLSRGSYLITKTPFQVEAWAFAFRFSPVVDGNGDLIVYNSEQTQYAVGNINNLVAGEYLVATDGSTTWSYYLIEHDFDLDIYAKSEFSSFMCTGQPLDKYPSGSSDLLFNPLIDKVSGLSLTTLEANNLDKIHHIQVEDDNLHANNSLVSGRNQADTEDIIDSRESAWQDIDGVWTEVFSIIKTTKDYIAARKTESAYDDIIFSIDPAPQSNGSTRLQWDSMITDIAPDLLMFNRYPWQPLQGLNIRQKEYGSLYAGISIMNIQANAGVDLTGNSPLPWGTYLQTWYAGLSSVMPYTYRKYHGYLSLLFGAKYLSTFIYNDYPNNHAIGLESYLFDSEGVPVIGETPQPTTAFYEQAELNRQIKILGNPLRLLQDKGQRQIKGTNIEHFVQTNQFAGGIYEWDNTAQPDPIITSVTVTRDDAPKTQDVWIGYFNPIHSDFGDVTDSYFMLCNGSWSVDASLDIRQRIRVDFDFGSDNSINSLIKLNKSTGFLEEIPLTPITGNTYYLDYVLKAGEGDLFKYNNENEFISNPQLILTPEEIMTPPFNLNQSIRIAGSNPIDADYIQEDIAGRDLLLTQGRVQESRQVYVKNIGDNTSALYILRGTTNSDWEVVGTPTTPQADMFKSTYDTDDSGVVDDADRLNNRLASFDGSADTIAVRDENGDLETRLFKSTFVDGATIDTTAAVMMRNSNADNNNFLRPITKVGFKTWLGSIPMTKEEIDALGVDAGFLSGRLLDFAAGANSVAGRDLAGKLSAQGFKTTDWEIKQIGGTLVITNGTNTMQFRNNVTSTIALLSDAVSAVTTTNKLVTQSDVTDATAENLTATGSISHDLNTAKDLKLHLTGGVTFTVTNTPTTNIVKYLGLIVTTENDTESFAIPSTWNKYGEYDPAVRNVFTLKFSYFATGGLEVDVFINQPES